MSLNKVMLIGNLGMDPEMRLSSDQKPYCYFTVATEDRLASERSTEWHNVITFNKLAGICSIYLKKGKKIYLEGSIRTSEYTDQAGNKRKSTKILATTVTFLDSMSVSKNQVEQQLEITHSSNESEIDSVILRDI